MVSGFTGRTTQMSTLDELVPPSTSGAVTIVAISMMRSDWVSRPVISRSIQIRLSAFKV